MPSERRRISPWLFLILAASFLLRLWLASSDLNASRFWDEQINLSNVAGVLSGSLRPANGFYQGLSYLPQAALLAAVEGLHRATGWEDLAVRNAAGFTPLAYFLCRLLQTLYGTLSLWATYLLGRRLFSEPVAILGVLLLSFSERHLHASVIFKPDILLLLWTVVAFLWILDVVEKPGLRSYLLAGLGVGLCAATKLNGVLVALPLAVVTAVLFRKERRVVLWLLLSGFVAAAVFIFWNPYLGVQAAAFERNLGHYERRSTGSHLDVLWQTLAVPFTRPFHGPLLGVCAVFGGVLTAASARREGGLRGLAFLSYPVAYMLLYAVVTTRFKENHFLQILPFTSLLAACFLFRALDRLRLPVRGTVLGLLAGWLALRAVVYVHGAVVPETRACASDFLSRSLPQPQRARLIYAESAVSPVMPGRPLRSGVVAVRSLQTVPAETLRLADAEVTSFSAAPARERRGEARRFSSRPFVCRGEEVTVLFHPWRSTGQRNRHAAPVAAPRKGWRIADLPLGVRKGETVSLSVRLPRLSGRSAELVVDGRTLPLVRVGKKGRMQVCLSPRFVSRGDGQRVRLRFQEHWALPSEIDYTVYRWAPPGSLEVVR
jgi:hypothetical protein